MRALAAALFIPLSLAAQALPAATGPEVTILERMAKDQLESAEDFLAAAKAKAQSPRAEDALAARELALVAWLLGQPNPIVAQAEDTYLIAMGLPPRFSQAGPGEAWPTDLHRIDFLLDPLSPREDAKLLKEQRLMQAWWNAEPPARFHGILKLHSQGARNSALPEDSRIKLLEIYRADALRSGSDLLAAAKVFTRSKKTGDLLLANELAALAAVRGEPMSRILFAQTWDRVLRALGQPARYGTLGSQTMAPGVAPGVIRNLGFSGRPTKR